MDEYILQNKIATLGAAIAVAWLAGALAGDWRVAFRSIAFNYGPPFACAFFVIGFSYDGPFSVFDMAAHPSLEQNPNADALTEIGRARHAACGAQLFAAIEHARANP